VDQAAGELSCSEAAVRTEAVGQGDEQKIQESYDGSVDETCEQEECKRMAVNKSIN
jgi:hypothetical protein